MRPADALLEILRDEGVTRIFGNPGTTELPLLDALTDAPDLQYTLGLQEGSVVAMADGYARATRRPAFLNLHVAAGLANGLIGLLNASRSGTPLVVTAGQQDRRHLVQDPMLSGDVVGLAAAATKSSIEVHHAADLPVLLRRAFLLAAAPPSGPVFLSIPMDLLADSEEVTVPARSRLAGPAVAAGVPEAAELLAGADRPVIVAGNGVAREDALAPLTALAQALGAVVHQQPMADAVTFPGTHPLHAGTLTATNAAVRAALSGHDVVLIVGCHAFTPHHYTPGPPIPDGIRVVQLDSDGAEIGRNFPATLGLVGGLAPTLSALADRLTGRVAAAGARIAAAAAAAAARRSDIERRARAGYGPAPIEPLAAAHAVADRLPEDAVVVEEAITTGIKLRSVLALDRPGSYVHTVGGGLGWGIGAAVGTALGRPDRPVVAVLGDGCAMFGLQGLWSAARYATPVTFVVMNNGEYRTLKDTLDASAGPRAGYPGLDLAPPALDFTRAADFFGIPAVRVSSADELAEVVAKGAGPDGPLLVDVPIAGHPGGGGTD